MVIQVKAKRAKTLKEGVFRLEFLNEFQRMAPEIKRDFAATTATWEGEKPKFSHKAFLNNGNPTLQILIGTGKGADKWNWLDKGTRVRYATMTPNFQGKTKVGFIGSFPGRGGLAYVDKRRPRPGIKPRGFRPAIERKWKRPIERRMKAANKRAAKKSGHGK